jgi:hypothetical protein
LHGSDKLGKRGFRLDTSLLILVSRLLQLKFFLLQGTLKLLCERRKVNSPCVATWARIMTDI